MHKQKLKPLAEATKDRVLEELKAKGQTKGRWELVLKDGNLTARRLRTSLLCLAPEKQPHHPYRTSTKARSLIKLAAALGVIAALVTASALWCFFDELKFAYDADDTTLQTHEVDYALKWLAACAIFWALAPPVWFWLEFWFVYQRLGEQSSEAFDRFKHNQQLSAAIWAGFLVLISTGFSAIF